MPGVAPELTYLDEAKQVGDNFAQGIKLGQGNISLQQNEQKLQQDMSIAQLQDATQRAKISADTYIAGEQARLGYAKIQSDAQLQVQAQQFQMGFEPIKHQFAMEEQNARLIGEANTAQIAHQADMMNAQAHIKQLDILGAVGTQTNEVINQTKDGKIDLDKADLALTYIQGKFAAGGPAVDSLIEGQRKYIQDMRGTIDKSTTRMANNVKAWGITPDDGGTSQQAFDSVSKQNAQITALDPILQGMGINTKNRGAVGPMMQGVLDGLKTGDLALDGGAVKAVKQTDANDQLAVVGLTTALSAPQMQTIRGAVAKNITAATQLTQLDKVNDKLTPEQRELLGSVTPSLDVANNQKLYNEQDPLGSFKLIAENTLAKAVAGSKYSSEDGIIVRDALVRQFDTVQTLANAAMDGNKSAGYEQYKVESSKMPPLTDPNFKGAVSAMMDKQKTSIQARLLVAAPGALKAVDSFGGVDAVLRAAQTGITSPQGADQNMPQAYSGYFNQSLSN